MLVVTIVMTTIDAHTLRWWAHSEQHARGGYSIYFTKSKSVHTLKGLALPRACHSGDIALAG